MSMEVFERLARVETRVDSMDKGIEKISFQLDKMDDKITNIQTSLASNKRDTSWTKRFIILLITLFVGAGVTLGYTVISNTTEPVQAAMKNETIKK
jgi:hypothetical protein